MGSVPLNFSASLVVLVLINVQNRQYCELNQPSCLEWGNARPLTMRRGARMIRRKRRILLLWWCHCFLPLLLPSFLLATFLPTTGPHLSPPELSRHGCSGVNELLGASLQCTCCLLVTPKVPPKLAARLGCKMCAPSLHPPSSDLSLSLLLLFLAYVRTSLLCRWPTFSLR